jgi:hypothetical protein
MEGINGARASHFVRDVYRGKQYARLMREKKICGSQIEER